MVDMVKLGDGSEVTLDEFISWSKIKQNANLRTKEQREAISKKISLAHKGKPSPNKGKTASDETKAKISLANIGKTASDETKAKISLANIGKIKSDETKAKISLAHKGKPAHNKGKPAHNKGKTMSAEAIAKRTLTRQLNKANKLLNAS